MHKIKMLGSELTTWMNDWKVNERNQIRTKNYKKNRKKEKKNHKQNKTKTKQNKTNQKTNKQKTTLTMTSKSCKSVPVAIYLINLAIFTLQWVIPNKLWSPSYRSITRTPFHRLHDGIFFFFLKMANWGDVSLEKSYFFSKVIFLFFFYVLFFFWKSK